MSWFKPKDLLDRTYEIGLFFKGFDGVIELIGGLFVLLASPATVDKITNLLTSRELNQDPNDFIATHILQYGHELTQGHHGFAAAFLLSHGLVKVVLVISLLRNKAWAYPFAESTLGIFTIYQIYILTVHFTIGMVFLTILDIIIIWLIWREWGKFIGLEREKA